jgi:hypothetical protein
MPFNFRELKAGDKVECIYIGYLKSVGAFKRPVFNFMDVKTKKDFHLWGTVMLNYVMYGIPFQSRIILKHIGMVESEKSKHKMKGFEIEVLETGAVGRVKKKIITPPKPISS